MEKKKRSMTEIIDNVYGYIEDKGGEIYVSNLREVTSNPATVLGIIKNIQDRPYLYFNDISVPNHENKGKLSKTHTTLKLSSQKRNPKHRYIQLEEVISFLDRSYQRTSDADTTKADLLLVITRTIDALNRISNRQPVDASYFL
jgi:hypothetical protein